MQLAKLGAAAGGVVPQVVWASSRSELKLPELIASGIHFAITPETPSASLRRSLQRSAQKGHRP